MNTATYPQATRAHGLSYISARLIREQDARKRPQATWTEPGELPPLGQWREQEKRRHAERRAFGS
jgi:hypothetical protein